MLSERGECALQARRAQQAGGQAENKRGVTLRKDKREDKREDKRGDTRGSQLGPRLHYLREPRGKYSGRPAKSGAHSWETSQVGGTPVGDNSGGKRVGSTLVGSNSARDYTTSGSLAGILGETSQVGPTLVGDRPSRGDTRRPEITLPPGASREIFGKTSQVGPTLVGDKPSRGGTRRPEITLPPGASREMLGPRFDVGA